MNQPQVLSLALDFPLFVPDLPCIPSTKREECQPKKGREQRFSLYDLYDTTLVWQILENTHVRTNPESDQRKRSALG